MSDQRTPYSVRGDSAGYGFSVEAYRWNPEGFRIRFGGGDRFNDTRLDFSTLTLVNLRQHSWLAEQRAVLLEVEIEHVGDSLHNIRNMFFLYDFARGDLRSCGLDRAWTFQAQHAAEETASCDELQAFAAKLK